MKFVYFGDLSYDTHVGSWLSWCSLLTRCSFCGALGWCALSQAQGVSNCTKEVGKFNLSQFSMLKVQLATSHVTQWLMILIVSLNNSTVNFSRWKCLFYDISVLSSGLGRRFRMHPGWICAGKKGREEGSTFFLTLFKWDFENVISPLFPSTLKEVRRVKMLALEMEEVRWCALVLMAGFLESPLKLSAAPMWLIKTFLSSWRNTLYLLQDGACWSRQLGCGLWGGRLAW